MQNLMFTPQYIADTKQCFKRSTKLDEFWSFCKKLHKAKKSSVDGLEFENFQYKFETKVQKFEELKQQYAEFLKHVPIIVPLKNWLEKYVLCTACSDEILDCFINLIENQIIPSHDSTGRIWDLELQRQVGHGKIIENIRCSSE